MSDQLALTIHQPWAELILAGRKSMEIRQWSTDYRGRLWIHAGKRVDLAAQQEFGLGELFTGGFVGHAVVNSVIRLDAERWERWRDRHMQAGSLPQHAYAWVLGEPARLARPVPARGGVKLFQLSDEMLKALAETR